MASRPAQVEMPTHIYDSRSDTRYKLDRFLGKGGFARCYELINERTRQHVAGKIVAKKMIEKKSQRDKMVQEIQIHQQLNHEHVVKMFGHFEDSLNIYIVLEVCDNRSLMELHKRRKYVLEEEARYYLGQIVDGVGYLHDRHTIHRDLKLGNLFLNKDMKVKIGDFGLATQVAYTGERKKTLCGTPNYIAPEMLCKKGHSFEVDIWAIGCIIYTLLVGKPPFETQTLQETYDRIKKNQYIVPARLPRYCGTLIDGLLHANPAKRPTIHQIRSSDFFRNGYYPTALPQSCLTTAPKFDFVRRPSRQPLAPSKPATFASHTHLPSFLPQVSNVRVPRPLESQPEKMILDSEDQNMNPIAKIDDGDNYLTDLLHMINNCLLSYREAQPATEDLLDPAAMPIFWISKWVDFSDKFGLGYMLNDDRTGALFKDETKLMANAAGEQIQYVDHQGVEQFYVAQNVPEQLKKKMTLLKYFRTYMTANLRNAGANTVVRAGDELERLPVVRIWRRMKEAIAFHLSNGTLQTNFFEDHEKFILCPLMSAITCITKNGEMFTITTQKMAEHGFSRELFNRLQAIKSVIENILSKEVEQPVVKERTLRPMATLGARGRSASARGLHFNRA